MRPRLSAPIGVELKLTNQCNLRCMHCIADSGQITNEELSLSEILSTIDELVRMKVFYIGFTGGEPLLHPDLFNIINYTTKAGIRTGITTNGTLITPDVAKKLRKSGAWLVRVSMDGHTPELHDWFRGRAGSFSMTCDGIKRLIGEHLQVTVLTVVSKHNFDTWENMISLCQELKVRALNTYVFVSEGRGKEKKELALSPNEYRDFLKRVLNVRRIQKDVQLITDAPLLSILRNSVDGSACPAGMFDLFIKENGDVTPCPYFPDAIGNLRNKSLSEIWQTNTFLDTLRKSTHLSAICRACEFVEACFGGCRAAAYCIHGTISAPDPNCWLVKEKIPCEQNDI